MVIRQKTLAGARGNGREGPIPDLCGEASRRHEATQGSHSGGPLQTYAAAESQAESTVRQWVRDDRDGFAARYQVARTLQVESGSDQIIEIVNREAPRSAR
jgi:hypothetical protein